MKLLSDYTNPNQRKDNYGTHSDEYPDINELEDGIYRALFYAWVLELVDGRMFKTHYGVKHGRRCAKMTTYQVVGGEFKEVPSFENGCTQHILELPNGKYLGRWYGSCFELSDGTCYKTDVGIRCSRKCAQLKLYNVVDGELTESTFDNGCTMHISQLKDGTYKGRWYAYCFELENGECYATDIGVLRSRELTPLGTYSVANGIVKELEMC